jgi:hypothetical protein
VQRAFAESLDPIATPLTGNINLTNADPPETNIDCGLWSEVHDQAYVGTLDVNDERFDGATVQMLLYIGGGSGTGLITGPVRVLDESGVIGRGLLTATTDGHVPLIERRMPSDSPTCVFSPTVNLRESTSCSC